MRVRRGGISISGSALRTLFVFTFLTVWIFFRSYVHQQYFLSRSQFCHLFTFSFILETVGLLSSDMLFIFFYMVLAMYSLKDVLCLSLLSLSGQRHDVSNSLRLAHSLAHTLASYSSYSVTRCENRLNLSSSHRAGQVVM